MEFGLSGLASGFDWRSLVDQLVDIERVPQRRLLADQDKLEQRGNAYGSMKTQLSILSTRLNALKETSLYDSRSITVGDSTVASGTVESGAPLGSYTFAITQLATAAKRNGTSNIGSPISSSGDVSGVVLSSAPFATAVTAGTFTVNGSQVTVATSDTLQDVFDKISTATGSEVTASYTSATDTITLTSGSSSEIVLGSATDTSNFLQVAKLYNNGSGSIESTASLGAIKTSAALSSANFATPVTTGSFKINGVAITFDATSDSLDNVIQRINDSTAGVTASYDRINDRVVLTNKATGDTGITLEDVSGNFLAAAGLTAGTLARGKDLLYTVNSGGQLRSQSNTITASSSGITGLTVTALKESSTTITVTTDTGKIKTAIKDFLTEFNKAQSIIDTETASSTDSKGKVTAGILADENLASEIASLLRTKANSDVSGLSGSIKRLADLGIESNGDDNSIELEDDELLDDALANSLSGIKQLFTDSSDGIAVRLSSYLDNTIGEEGSLVTRQDNLSTQATGIDTQITDLERIVQSNRQRLIDSFVLMETAQAQINQQLQFLQQRLKVS